MMQKTETKEPKILQMTGDDFLSGTVLKLDISESSANIMRTDNGYINFINLLQRLEIGFSWINPVGMLIFLRDLEVEVETLDHIQNDQGEVYTIVHIFSNIDNHREELFNISYDPNISDSSAYAIIKKNLK